jgi:hypothetical protein
MTNLKPMFAIGDKVVVIPFAGMGAWTHIDMTLNQKGVATITDWDICLPTTAEEIKDGCLKGGYIEYKLQWAGNQEGRAKYFYAEKFLTRAGTPLAREIAKYYKLTDKATKLKVEYDKLTAILATVTYKFKGY